MNVDPSVQRSKLSRKGWAGVILAILIVFSFRMGLRFSDGGACSPCSPLSLPLYALAPPEEAKKKAPKDPELSLKPDLSTPDRMVAIGDVHGDNTSFKAILKKSGLVNEKLDWSGGKTVFVQIGDLLDRGPHSRQAMDLMIKLEEQAPKKGGKVFFVIGNHEVFNLVGDLRYLHQKELEPYAKEETKEMRTKRLQNLEAFVSKPHPRLKSGFYNRFDRKMRTLNEKELFPPGYFRHKDLFTRNGKYGKWILSHEAVVKVGDSLFVHAGLDHRYGAIPFRKLRKHFKAELIAYLKLVEEFIKEGIFHKDLGFLELYDLVAGENRFRNNDPKIVNLVNRFIVMMNGIVFSMDGPVWYRGLAQGSEFQLAASLKRTLKSQEAARIIIGHTQPRNLKIQARFSGQVILIDTGMNNAVYRGSPQALLFEKEKGLSVISIK